MTKTDFCGFAENVEMNVQNRFENCIPIHQCGTILKELEIKRDPNMIFLLRRAKACGDSSSSRMEETQTGRIKTGESVIKNLYFNSSKCNSEVNKIHAFWKRIEEEGWEPATCRVAKSETKEAQKKEERDEFLWLNALVEMKKRKMDELAFLGKSKVRCKMCETGVDFDKLKNYTKDLKVVEDIASLNKWSSKSIPRKETSRTKKESGQVKAKTKPPNSVQSTKEVIERTKSNEIDIFQLKLESKKIEKYLYPLKYQKSITNFIH